MKLCLFGALVAGYPLPELSLDFGTGNSASDKVEAPAMTAVSPAENRQSVTSPAQPQAPVPPAASGPVALAEEPQGAAAARAAAAMRPSGNKLLLTETPKPALTAPQLRVEPAPMPVAEITPEEPKATGASGTTGAAASQAATPSTTASPPDGDDTSWWGNILQATRLPFPRLGVDQVAHAATLDTPPPPSVTPRTEESPFVPPTQAIPRGQNPDGSPLPPRSTTARPLPAGTSGPQLDQPASNVPASMVPNAAPPAPRVDAYVAPEDPNRQKQELARREQEVLVLKQQMEQRLEELQNAERKVQDMLREAKAVEDQKINTLVGMYTNMKPKQAAKALEALDEHTAVKILTAMTPKQSGDILSYADPAKTAKLTEILSRMRLEQ